MRLHAIEVRTPASSTKPGANLRLAVLDELAADLRSGQNVVVMSPRRYGKTSLILKVIDLVRDQGGLVAYLDLFGLPTKAARVA